MRNNKKRDRKLQTKAQKSPGWFSRENRKYLLILIAVMALSFTLAMITVDRGITGYASWQPDSIEGMQTVSHSQLLFKQWRHKYPRGHYLINYIFYKPHLDKWKKDPIKVKQPDGKVGLSVINPERLSKLASISHRITVFMSVVVICLTALITVGIFGDYLAAVLAALALTLCNIFVFYSSSGCVDVPAMFWFALSMFFAVLAVNKNSYKYYILLGLASAYCICTKEGAGTFILGLWLGAWVLLIHKGMANGKNFKQAALAIFSLKALAAIIAAMALGLVMEGFLAGSHEFTERMKFWEGVQQDFDNRYGGPWKLLQTAASQLYSSWGWSLLIPAAAGIILFAKKFRFQLIFMLLPLVAFYAMAFLKIHFLAPRFVLCGFIAIAILIGKALADSLRWKKLPIPLKCIIPAIVFIPSLMYCIGMSVEMKYDTRARTEQWVYENIPKGEIFGSAMKRQYAPRIGFNGYQQIHQWSSQGIQTRQGLKKYWPKYILASRDWPCLVKTESRAFKKQLLKGETQYKQIAHFTCQYLPPQNWFWSYAIWPEKRHGRISPEIRVFEKQETPK